MNSVYQKNFSKLEFLNYKIILNAGFCQETHVRLQNTSSKPRDSDSLQSNC